MKITAFNGSPKGEKGNTNVMVTAFLQGAEQAGAEVENILLATKKINHCQACGSCTTSKGKCIIEDDMTELIKKYIQSDIVVLASPLHIDNVSGMMKVFMDRTLCIGNPYYEKDEHGEYRGGKSKHFKNGTPPKIVAISSSGYPQRSNFQVVSLLMKRIARNFHMELIAEIYATEGGILTANVKELEALVEGYKKLLQQAGQEVVESREVSEQTQKLLDANFIPEEVYVEKMNQIFDMILKQGD